MRFRRCDFGAVKPGGAHLLIAQIGITREVAQWLAVDPREQSEARSTNPRPGAASRPSASKTPTAQNAHPVCLGTPLRALAETGLFEIFKTETNRQVVAEGFGARSPVCDGVESAEEIGM